MRSRTVRVIGVIGLTAALLLPAEAVAATGDAVPSARQPRCGDASAKDFPIGTRMHGGPPDLHPGGGFAQWSVELVNTTGRACRNIHPVLVFAGQERGLTPDRMVVEFSDDKSARWRPALLETTSEDEVIAVLDSDGAHQDRGGFTVPERATLTVRVRLAVTSDTPPHAITVNAAVVQRRGDDGDWVGESDDYRLTVLGGDTPGTAVTRDELATTGSTSLPRLGAALGTVLAGGVALALVSRRLRSRDR